MQSQIYEAKAAYTTARVGLLKLNLDRILDLPQLVRVTFEREFSMLYATVCCIGPDTSRPITLVPWSGTLREDELEQRIASSTQKSRDEARRTYLGELENKLDEKCRELRRVLQNDLKVTYGSYQWRF